MFADELQKQAPAIAKAIDALEAQINAHRWLKGLAWAVNFINSLRKYAKSMLLLLFLLFF